MIDIKSEDARYKHK